MRLADKGKKLHTERERVGVTCALYMCVYVEGGLAMPLEIDCPHTHILMAEMVR